MGYFEKKAALQLNTVSIGSAKASQTIADVRAPSSALCVFTELALGSSTNWTVQIASKQAGLNAVLKRRLTLPP